jgi:hypothetical protein
MGLNYKVNIYQAQQALTTMDMNHDGRADKKELFLAMRFILESQVNGNTQITNPQVNYNQTNQGVYGGQNQYGQNYGMNGMQNQSYQNQGWGNINNNQGLYQQMGQNCSQNYPPYLQPQPNPQYYPQGNNQNNWR